MWVVSTWPTEDGTPQNITSTKPWIQIMPAILCDTLFQHWLMTTLKKSIKKWNLWWLKMCSGTRTWKVLMCLWAQGNLGMIFIPEWKVQLPGIIFYNVHLFYLINIRFHIYICISFHQYWTWYFWNFLKKFENMLPGTSWRISSSDGANKDI